MNRDEERESRIIAYLRGDGSPDERAAFEADLGDDADLKAEFAAMAGVRAALAADAAEAAGARADGWDRLSVSIDAYRAAGAANDNRFGRRRWRVALLRAASVAVAAVFLWEVAVSPLIDERTADLYAPVADGGAALGVVPELVADVLFAAEAPIGDVAALIRSVGGEIVAGPSAIGLYRLRFETTEARDAALTALSGRPELIVSATPG